jgi:FHA domain
VIWSVEPMSRNSTKKKSIRDELSQIDSSPIPDLVRIKEQEDTLHERLSKMETAKDRVSAAVYEKVREDYQTRLAQLDLEGRPLKEKARTEYSRLCALQAQAERLLEEASLVKEEIEFRLELGEFDDKEFKERLAQCEDALEEPRALLKEAENLRQQFRQVFRSEDQLEDSAPAATSLPAEPPATVPGSSSEATLLSVTRPTTPNSNRPADTMALSAGPRPQRADRGQNAEIDPAGAEMTHVTAQLVLMIDGHPEKRFILKPGANSIGRSPKNQVPLLTAEVSRQHAEIALCDRGYRILDLESDNGIFVNGEQVKDRILADGDVIRIGTHEMLFRA